MQHGELVSAGANEGLAVIAWISSIIQNLTAYAHWRNKNRNKAIMFRNPLNDLNISKEHSFPMLNSTNSPVPLLYCFTLQSGLKSSMYFCLLRVCFSSFVSPKLKSPLREFIVTVWCKQRQPYSVKLLPHAVTSHWASLRSWSKLILIIYMQKSTRNGMAALSVLLLPCTTRGGGLNPTSMLYGIRLTGITKLPIEYDCVYICMWPDNLSRVNPCLELYVLYYWFQDQDKWLEDGQRRLWGKNICTAKITIKQVRKI